MSEVRPFRCFDLRITGIALLVAAAIIVLALIGKRFEPGSVPRLLCAVGQAAAYVALVLAMGRSIRTLDELEQHIHLEAFAAVCVLFVVVIGGWAFFEQAGLPAVRWSQWILLLFAISHAVAVRRISRRYR